VQIQVLSTVILTSGILAAILLFISEEPVSFIFPEEQQAAGSGKTPGNLYKTARSDVPKGNVLLIVKCLKIKLYCGVL